MKKLNIALLCSALIMSVPRACGMEPNNAEFSSPFENCTCATPNEYLAKWGNGQYWFIGNNEQSAQVAAFTLATKIPRWRTKGHGRKWLPVSVSIS